MFWDIQPIFIDFSARNFTLSDSMFNNWISVLLIWNYWWTGKFPNTWHINMAVDRAKCDNDVRLRFHVFVTDNCNVCVNSYGPWSTLTVVHTVAGNLHKKDGKPRSKLQGTLFYTICSDTLTRAHIHFFSVFLIITKSFPDCETINLIFVNYYPCSTFRYCE